MKRISALVLVFLSFQLYASAQFFKVGPEKTVPVIVSHPPQFGLTVADRLKKLESLYKQGLITKKEYDEKRAAILKDL